MKNGKRPTRNQRFAIQQARLNPDNWFVSKNPPGQLHLIHRHTFTTRIILTD
ncbi:DUF6906 family protein [Paenibacillus chitinolyticus]|uniref:DUF6906 family protein n=1 Tax=Paenibacillus chitinolyticus TaxID=79263 RepID=UPI003669DAC6